MANEPKPVLATVIGIEMMPKCLCCEGRPMVCKSCGQKVDPPHNFKIMMTIPPCPKCGVSMELTKP